MAGSPRYRSNPHKDKTLLTCLPFQDSTQTIPSVPIVTTTVKFAPVVSIQSGGTTFYSNTQSGVIPTPRILSHSLRQRLASAINHSRSQQHLCLPNDFSRQYQRHKF